MQRREPDSKIPGGYSFKPAVAVRTTAQSASHSMHTRERCLSTGCGTRQFPRLSGRVPSVIIVERLITRVFYRSTLRALRAQPLHAVSRPPFPPWSLLRRIMNSSGRERSDRIRENTDDDTIALRGGPNSKGTTLRGVRESIANDEGMQRLFIIAALDRVLFEEWERAIPPRREGRRCFSPRRHPSWIYLASPNSPQHRRQPVSQRTPH